MTRNTKIILGILSGLVVVCICFTAAVVAVGFVGLNRMANYVEQNASEDPQQISTAAANIAAFDLPNGYQPEFTMDILGMKMVGFSRDNKSIIMMLQMPTSLQANAQQMQEQMQKAMQSQFNTGGNESKVVDQIQTEINGQPATLTISEYTADNDETTRQLTTLFQGKGGLVMLMLVSPASTWDQDEIDAFIGSIH